MNEEVFTPKQYGSNLRLRFPMTEVLVLSGDLNQRGLGKKAEVEIHGQRYEVIGASCGTPNCQCDAVLKPAP